MSRRNSTDALLRERAAAVIPGGMYGHQATGLLPDDYPQFFSRAKGARLWDADGNQLIDYMCAYGPNLLGYGDPEVDGAYIKQLGIGDTLTGPTALIVELAEKMVSMISHADWAMFCKNGTDATSMALVTARAYRRRKTIIRAKGAYHGAAPWCVPRPAGTFDEDRHHQILCDYNDVASLEAAVAQAGEDLAGIFAAPFKHDAFIDQEGPTLEYARRCRELCDEKDALLIVDDVRAGFRVSRDCSWSAIGVEPDLSTWGKCIANGHPISALLGSDKARKAASVIYVTGSFWYQAAPMAAALVTLDRIANTGYLENLNALGQLLRDGLAERAKAAGFSLRQTGPVTMPLFLFDDDPDLRKGFFWGSQLLERGVYLHPWHNGFLCDAMTKDDIDLTLNAAEGAFASLKSAAPKLEPVAKMAFLAPH